MRSARGTDRDHDIALGTRGRSMPDTVKIQCGVGTTLRMEWVNELEAALSSK